MRKPNLNTFPKSPREVNALLKSLGAPERMRRINGVLTWTSGTAWPWRPSQRIEGVVSERTLRDWLVQYWGEYCESTLMRCALWKTNDGRTLFYAIAKITGQTIINPTSDVAAAIQEFHELELQFRPIPNRASLDTQYHRGMRRTQVLSSW